MLRPLAVAALLSLTTARAGLVYSNMATRIGTMHALVNAGAANGPEHGNRVVLAGTDRIVNRIDVMVRIGESGVAEFNVRVRLYANDGPQGAPSTQLWDSQARHVVIDSGTDLPYAFFAPNVIVPDTFTWTLEITDRAGFNQSALGMPHYGPPTVGAAVAGYWINSPNGWQQANGEPPFGARVYATGTCSPDFNHDGDTGTDADIEAFFACIAGSCCAACDTADYNGDGDVGTDADIEAFFRVLAGSPC